MAIFGRNHDKRKCCTYSSHLSAGFVMLSGLGPLHRAICRAESPSSKWELSPST
jgi:hypothetical protein